MDSSEDLGPCTICQKPKARYCGRCKSIRYCSKQCQKTDWPVHKLLCSAFPDFDDSQHPSKDHFRGILFPVADTRPRFVWIRGIWEGEGVESYQRAQIDSFFDEKRPIRTEGIPYNFVLARGPPGLINITAYSLFLSQKDMEPTKSMAALTNTQQAQPYDWRGPFVATGETEAEDEDDDVSPIACRDLDMNDFHHVANYFLARGADHHRYLIQSLQRSGPLIRGVSINCVARQQLNLVKPFHEVHLPKVGTFELPYLESDIAKLVQVPIRMISQGQVPKWPHKSEVENLDAKYLRLCCDPNAKSDHSRRVPGWGELHPDWAYLAGDIIAVRSDAKPLFPQHVEALCKFCRYEVLPPMERSIMPNASANRQAVLAKITPATFADFYCQIMEMKKDTGERAGVPSPYEV